MLFKRITKKCGKSQKVFVLRHELFGDQEPHVVNQWFKIMKKGPPEQFFIEKSLSADIGEETGIPLLDEKLRPFYD